MGAPGAADCDRPRQPHSGDRDEKRRSGAERRAGSRHLSHDWMDGERLLCPRITRVYEQTGGFWRPFSDLRDPLCSSAAIATASAATASTAAGATCAAKAARREHAWGQDPDCATETGSRVRRPRGPGLARHRCPRMGIELSQEQRYPYRPGGEQNRGDDYGRKEPLLRPRRRPWKPVGAELRGFDHHPAQPEGRQGGGDAALRRAGFRGGPRRRRRQPLGDDRQERNAGTRRSRHQQGRGGDIPGARVLRRRVRRGRGLGHQHREEPGHTGQRPHERCREPRSRSDRSRDF